MEILNLNRMNDALFKNIFAQNSDITLSLINAVFEFQGTALITDIEFIDRNLDSTKAYRYTWFVQDARENWTADPNASRTIPVSNPEYQELLNSQPDGKNFLQHYYHKDTP